MGWEWLRYQGWSNHRSILSKKILMTLVSESGLLTLVTLNDYFLLSKDRPWASEHSLLF